MKDKKNLRVLGDDWNSTLSIYVKDNRAGFRHLGMTAIDYDIQGARKFSEMILQRLLSKDYEFDVVKNDAIPNDQLVMLKKYQDENNHTRIRVQRIYNLVRSKSVAAFKETRIGDAQIDQTLIIDAGGDDKNAIRNRSLSKDGWNKLIGDDSPIILLPGEIPSQSDFDRDNGLWKYLKSECPSSTIICSASSLRVQGTKISRRLSWESTIDDFQEELKHYQPLSTLSTFKNLIVRFGVTAIMHQERYDRKAIQNFYFDPNAAAGIFRDPDESGRILGKNVFVAAAILKSGVNGKTDFATAMRSAIEAVQAVYSAGFPTNILELDEKPQTNGEFIRDYVKPALESFGRDVAGYRIGRVSDDMFAEVSKYRDQEVNNHRWSILNLSVRGLNQRPERRAIVAMAVAKFGCEEVLNKPASEFESEVATLLSMRMEKHDHDKNAELFVLPELHDGYVDKEAVENNLQREAETKPIFVPIVKFDKYVAIERGEIEALRAIQNLMRQYIRPENWQKLGKPLSIAVFGAPGTGKSFAVKQIAKGFGDAVQTVEFNLAQMELSDLGQSMAIIRDINLTKKVPLVFFDEFDGGGGKWFEQFLAPMQDGEYRNGSQLLNIGRAIFVFAGGTSQSFKAFDKRQPSRDNLKDQEFEALNKEFHHFVAQKGPDFVSRLRGHIDIASINPAANLEKDKELKPLVRRGIILRGLIEGMSSFDENSDGLKVAKIDDAVLYALLTINEYRHGVRSLQAILEMSSNNFGTVDPSSLPSPTQLAMHVDPSEFSSRMKHYRLVEGINRPAD